MTECAEHATKLEEKRSHGLESEGEIFVPSKAALLHPCSRGIRESIHIRAPQTTDRVYIKYTTEGVEDTTTSGAKRSSSKKSAEIFFFCKAPRREERARTPST